MEEAGIRHGGIDRNCVAKGLGVIVYCIISILDLSGQKLQVFDKETSIPLSYVNVTTNKDFSGITDEGGQIDISNWRGIDTLTFSMVGYETESLIFTELREVNFRIYMVPAKEMIEMVTISANRWAETKGEVPNRVSMIDQSQILLDNPQTAADLLTSSGQVYVQKSQMGGGSPIIRGFSTSRVLLVIDGVRMNNAIFRSGNVQNVISIDPLAVASTEVSFGPGSIMYGSDAIGGVMHFLTLSPNFNQQDKLSLKGKFYGRFSSANQEKMGHFHFALENNKWSTLTSMTYSNFGDLRMGTHGPDDYLRTFFVDRENGVDLKVENAEKDVQIQTGYDQINLMQKIKYSPDKKQFLTYGMYYSETSDVPRYDRLIQIRKQLPRYGDWFYGPQKWLFQHLKYHSIKKNYAYDEIDITLAHQDYQESRVTREFNALERFDRRENLDIYSINLDLKKKLGDWTWFYGSEWIYNGVHSSGSVMNLATEEVSSAPDRYPQATWQSVGTYLTTKKWISDSWLLQLGGRWNLYSIKADFTQSLLNLPFSEANLDFHTLSGNLGLLHRFTPKNHLSFNLSSGMRAPNVDDLGKVFDSAPGRIVVPNPELRSEVAYNTELNYLHSFGKNRALEASVYYTYLDHAMVRRNFEINGKDSIYYDGELSLVQAIQNASDAYVAGMQLGFKSTIITPLVFSTNLNFQFGREKLANGESSTSRHVVPIFGNAQLSYTRPKWKLISELRFQGEMSAADLPVTERDKSFLYASDEMGLPYAPAWWVWNLKFTYRTAGNIQLNGGVENLLDIRYRPYSSGIASPGRNFIFALGIDF